MYELTIKSLPPGAEQPTLRCASSDDVLTGVQSLFSRCPEAISVEVRCDGTRVFQIPRPRPGEALNILPL